jgi:hypothetical protein
MSKSMEKMKEKVIKWGDYHVLRCAVCWEMERRGYRSEEVYWDDVFSGKLRPVKYWLAKEKRNDTLTQAKA